MTYGKKRCEDYLLSPNLSYLSWKLIIKKAPMAVWMHTAWLCEINDSACVGIKRKECPLLY